MITRKYFDSELRELNEKIIKMGEIAEKQILKSVVALKNQDGELAKEVISNDDQVDNMQKEIEDKCIKLIARQQPLAIDLRIIFTTIKIIGDLERIADYAVDISKITNRLLEEKYIKELDFVPKMGEKLSEMIKKCMRALNERDIQTAYEVCAMDDDIDTIYKMLYVELLPIMAKDQQSINQITQFLFAAKFLERGADHVTNICESLIYLVTGEQKILND